MTKRKTTANTTAIQNAAPLLGDLRQLIDEARRTAAAAVNISLTMLYWRIGKRIRDEVLGNERAEYGKEIMPTLSAELAPRYGRGFTEKNLHRMVQFAEAFQDEEIVATLWRQLSWSHFRELLPLKKPLQREFYAEMCRIEGWSVRTLSERIDSMLYERTALSRKPEELIRVELDDLRAKGALTTSMLLKDPYILDFLGLNNRYVEKDLEDAILSELETFILELGAGFSFVARQKRLQIDGDDFYIDLLFYNRRLRRLVAIELKIGRFKHAYKSQMELYLRWLDKYEREADELSPLGIILCAEKNSEQVELLELDASGIHVAEYLTVLPSRDVLHERLQAAIKSARARFNNGSENQ
jgi:predicted nuclease of restriction endonuclease-like (RecB) superfamily